MRETEGPQITVANHAAPQSLATPLLISQLLKSANAPVGLRLGSQIKIKKVKIIRSIYNTVFDIIICEVDACRLHSTLLFHCYFFSTFSLRFFYFNGLLWERRRIWQPTIVLFAMFVVSLFGK